MVACMEEYTADCTLVVECMVVYVVDSMAECKAFADNEDSVGVMVHILDMDEDPSLLRHCCCADILDVVDNLDLDSLVDLAECNLHHFRCLVLEPNKPVRLLRRSQMRVVSKRL